MASFNAALSQVIKWSVGNNRFDQDGANPKMLMLFIPKQSIREFAHYLLRLADQNDKLKSGKIWDYALAQEVEVDGFYINAKGKNGQDGAYGNINPVQIPASSTPVEALDF